MTHSTTPTKTCTSCNKEFPTTAEYFHRDKHAPDGLARQCKACRQPWHPKYQREWDRSNPPTKFCTQCGENKPTTTEYFHRPNSAKYELDTLCKVCRAENSRAQREIDRARARRVARAWLERNRERKAKTDSAWRKNNRGRVREYSQHRRARKMRAEGSHTAEDIQQQYKNQRGRCYYAACGHSKLNDTFHVDHVIPLSRGGSDDLSNLVLTCPTCNLKKHNKLPSEWPEGGRLL